MADKNTNDPGDLKKFFDPKQYNTVIVNTDGQMEFNEDKIANLVSLLTDPANKELKRDVLNALRENQKTSVPMLIEAIKSDKSQGNRHLMIAACWEAELNLSNYLPFFTGLAVNEDYLSALEATTVIENMAGPFDKNQVKESIQIVESFLGKGDHEKGLLLKDLLITLQSLPF